MEKSLSLTLSLIALVEL